MQHECKYVLIASRVMPKLKSKQIFGCVAGCLTAKLVIRVYGGAIESTKYRALTHAEATRLSARKESDNA